MGLQDCEESHISDFSTGILEALAMGKPAIYHNPHGEKVNKFWEPMEAYEKTNNIESLIQAVRKYCRSSPPKSSFEKFLDLHCNVKNTQVSSQQSAIAMIEIINSQNLKSVSNKNFIIAVQNKFHY